VIFPVELIVRSYPDGVVHMLDWDYGRRHERRYGVSPRCSQALKNIKVPRTLICKTFCSGRSGREVECVLVEPNEPKLLEILIFDALWVGVPL